MLPKVRDGLGRKKLQELGTEMGNARTNAGTSMPRRPFRRAAVLGRVTGTGPRRSRR